MKLKNILKIIMILHFGIVYSQNYHKMIRDSMSWEMARYDTELGESFGLYFFNGIETLNGITYHRLTVENRSISSDGNQSTYFSGFEDVLMREDTSTKKIFGLNLNDSSEYLIYDFSLNIGDTISGTNIIIDSIANFECFDGVIRKRFYTQQNGIYFTEALGSPIAIHDPFAMNLGFGWYVSCIETPTSLKSGINCNPLINSIANKGIEPMSFYPNPAVNEIKICGDLIIEKVQVYTISGRLAYEYLCKDKEIIVNVSEMEKGIYFIIVNNSISKKIIIENGR